MSTSRAAAPERPHGRSRPVALPRRSALPAPGAVSGRPRVGREAGQASIELVALLPLTLVVGLAVLALLASRAASGQAAAAAQAGAMALIQDGDPRAAARAALPPAARRRATISVRDRAITVTVRPHTELRFLADTLSATASANAGPEP